MPAPAPAPAPLPLPVGIAVGHPGIPLPEAVALAAAADAAGLHAVGAGDGFVESFSTLGAIAAATSRIRLLTTVATWTRTPVTTAVGAASLDELSGGRFALGLGTMPKEWSEGWHGVPYDRPVERMRDFVAAVRACWAASPAAPLARTGSHYRIEGYVPLGVRPARPIPVYLGTTRPGMTELAGEIADGVVVNNLNSASWLRERVLPALERGLERGGRSRADLDLGVAVYCAVAGSEGEALELARTSLAFYLPVPYFADLLAHLGHGGAVERGQAALARGDLAAAAQAIPDEVVDAVAVCGTPAQVRAKLARYAGLADWLELMAPLGHPPDVTRAQVAAQVALAAPPG